MFKFHTLAAVSFNQLGDLAMAQGNLAESAPANAARQPDLAVLHYYKQAYFAQEHGDDAGFQAELRACYLVLHHMQQRSLHFDPTLAQVYQ